MGKALERLDDEVRRFFSEVHPGDVVTGWVLVAHRVSASDLDRSVVGRVAQPDQAMHVTRGLLDVALSAERNETRDRS